MKKSELRQIIREEIQVITESGKYKEIFKFELQDENGGNQTTLRVYQPEGTYDLDYSYYLGWGSSGVGYSIQNMSLKKPLPPHSYGFRSTDGLRRAIASSLDSASRNSSTYIARYVKYNDIAK